MCHKCSLRAGPHQRRGVTKCQEPVHQTGTSVADHIRRHLLDYVTGEPCVFGSHGLVSVLTRMDEFLLSCNKIIHDEMLL